MHATLLWEPRKAARAIDLSHEELLTAGMQLGLCPIEKSRPTDPNGARRRKSHDMDMVHVRLLR